MRGPGGDDRPARRARKRFAATTARAHQPDVHRLVPGARDRAALHPARQARPERLHRALQSDLPRRGAERLPVRVDSTTSGDHHRWLDATTKSGRTIAGKTAAERVTESVYSRSKFQFRTVYLTGEPYAGTSFFSGEFLQAIDHQQLLGDQPLQLGVLTLQILQSPSVGHVHPAILVAPAEERLLGYVLLAAELPDLQPDASASRSIRTICSSVNRFFICQSSMVKLPSGLTDCLATTYLLRSASVRTIVLDVCGSLCVRQAPR